MGGSDPEVKIYYHRESVARSLARDGFSFVSAVGIIGIGALLESSAMQWTGFIFILMGMFGFAMRHVGDRQKTPQEMADYLLHEYGVVGREDE